MVLARKLPQNIANNPNKTKEIEFTNAFIYSSSDNKWIISNIHPLNVVKEPQKANPKINLYLCEEIEELKKPNKKQPRMLTKNNWSICHLNNAAGTVPIEIKMKLEYL